MMILVLSLFFVAFEEILCILFIDPSLYSTELDLFDSSSFRPFVEKDIVGIAQCARICVHQTSCQSAIFDKDLLSCLLMTSQYSSDPSTSLLSADTEDDDQSFAISQSLIPQVLDPSTCWNRACPLRHRCVVLTSGKSLCVISHCEVRSFSVENGVIQATNGYGVGSIIHYICNEGYTLNGTSNVNTTAKMACNAQGVWEGEEPLCDKIIIYCGVPPVLQHGHILPGGSREDTVRTYQCDALYYMKGPGNITCLSSGEWTAVEGVCKLENFCGSVPSLLNGIVSAGNSREDTNRTYSCDTGYYIVGKNSVICQSDGTWSVLEATCELEQFCSTLPILSNGVVSEGNNREGTERTYTCNTGYYMDGGGTSTCQSDGTWSALDSTCEVENFCPEPPSSIPHGSITEGTRREGATRTYTCSSGYAMEGSASITCQSSGYWTIFAGECKYCLPPNDPRGLNYNGDLAETQDGQPCGDWTMVNKYQDLWSHGNKCRNPDGDVRPWCALDVQGISIIWEYCDLHPCP